MVAKQVEYLGLDYIREYDFLRETINNILLKDQKDFWSSAIPPNMLFKVMQDMGLELEGDFLAKEGDVVFRMKHWALGQLEISVSHMTGFKAGFFVKLVPEDDES